MSDVRRYLASIGRKGGMKSRRTLDPDTARAMVRAREARRSVRRAGAPERHPADDLTPRDVMTSMLERQLERYREMAPAEKLAIADSLWDLAFEATKAGVRLRNRTLDDAAVETAALRLLRHAPD